VHELAEYLSRRYPTTFVVARDAAPLNPDENWKFSWTSDPPIARITIVPLGVSYKMSPDMDPVRALEVAALLSVRAVRCW